ncbi:hypothetical protein [Dendrosporobacter sp. 1207_IL3150]|uniref:hypothetical protein n=1 Tax=Dendrosporobacter sp. 1207_IL3150 TaxID=3084054 RepID=UPI002FDAFCD0
MALKRVIINFDNNCQVRLHYSAGGTLRTAIIIEAPQEAAEEAVKKIWAKIKFTLAIQKPGHAY